MKSTEHISLKKPDVEDFYDVNVVNDNMDKIDAEVYKMQQDIKDITEITEEELSIWYYGDTGIPNAEITRMYEEDIVYEEDTGIPNEEIDAMYM